MSEWIEATGAEFWASLSLETQSKAQVWVEGRGWVRVHTDGEKWVVTVCHKPVRVFAALKLGAKFRYPAPEKTEWGITRDGLSCYRVDGNYRTISSILAEYPNDTFKLVRIPGGEK